MPAASGPRDRHPAAATVLALVHSNCVVALAAASVALTATLLADLPVAWPPLFVAFAATLFVYTADRIADRDADADALPERTAFFDRHGRAALAAGALLYAAACAVVVARGVSHAEALVLPVAATACYTVNRAKRHLLVKNVLVGAGWGVVPLGVGAYHGRLWTPPVLAFAAWTTAMLTVAAVVFDVKDVAADRDAGVRTLPVVYGPATTRRVAQAANLVVATAVVAAVAANAVRPRFLLLLAQHAAVAAYIPFATPDRSACYYGLVVDGEHLLLAAVVALAHAAGVV